MERTTPKQLVDLFKEYGSKHNLPKNYQLVVEGEAADTVYYILSGSISVMKETASGREFTTRICSTNDCIAENIIFTPMFTYPISAKVIDNAVVLSLKKAYLELLLNQHKPLLIEWIQWIQLQNISEQSKMRDLLLHGKKGALCSTLIRLANTFGEKQPNNTIIIQQQLTNTDLAKLCATSREVINRMVQQLKREHIIQYENGYITILNLSYLRNVCECENCSLKICTIN